MKEFLKFNSFNFVGNSRKNTISSVAHAVGSTNDQMMKTSRNEVEIEYSNNSALSIRVLKNLYLMCIFLFVGMNIGYSSANHFLKERIYDSPISSINVSNTTSVENLENTILLDCDFVITKTSCLENGTVRICVEAVNPPANCTNNWVVTSNGTTLTSANGEKVCLIFTEPSSSGYTIEHYCGVVPCDLPVSHVQCDNDCETRNFSYTVDDCLATVSLDYICIQSGSLFVNWGDGSLSEPFTNASTNTTHQYWNTSNSDKSYEVCFSWINCSLLPNEGDPFPGDILATCCYPVIIPPCDPCDNVTLNWQECPVPIEDKCCVELSVTHSYAAIDYHWVITELSSGNVIYTNTTVNPFLNYNFIGEGPYRICVTLELADGTSFECCFIRSFPPCECCDDADFTLLRQNYSCQKFQYEVDPICDEVGITKHKWIFSDGTEYWGLQPPPHIFTDYENTTGEVCVTHEIYCGGILQDVVTKCDVAKLGAYLGLLGETRKMTDVLSNLFGAPTVYQFLTDMVNAGTPVYIEGDLEVDIDVDFDGSNGGEWDMGQESIIYVNKKRFGLLNMIIQDAARVGFPGCCRWQGIQVVAGSELDWLNAHIHDARTMLDLLPSSTTDRTFMNIRKCVFEANYKGIHWQDHKATVTDFYQNFFNNPDDCANLVCGCCYTIAIHLDNVSTGVIFPKNAPTNGFNNIHGYQHGFKVENTSLNVKNFIIEHLKTDATQIGGNGIWYIKNTSTYRHLYMDIMQFTDMKTGVKMEVSGGGYQRLRAIASIPYTSITMDDVHKGYDIDIAGSSRMRNRSYISYNSINTNGGSTSFGVKMNVLSSTANYLKILQNHINVNGGITSTGVSLTSGIANRNQYVFVQNNIITNNANNDGPGIYVSNWRKAIIEENQIFLSNKKAGIEVNSGSYHRIKCNDVTDGLIGIKVFQSQNNDINGNTLFDQKRSMEVSNDCMGLGTNITKNQFNFSTYFSNLYDKEAVTGAQEHEEYNKWINQNNNSFGNPEVKHQNAGLWPRCYYFAPDGAAIGSPYRPFANPIKMFDPILHDPANSDDPCNPGGGTGGGGNGFPMTILESGEIYASIIGNDTIMDSMSVAPRIAFEQSVYMQIEQNPIWQTTYPVLNSFYLSSSSTFVGESADIYLLLNDLQSQLETQEATMALDYDQLDIWNSELDSLEVLLGQTNTATGIALLEGQINILLPLIQSLQLSVDTQVTAYEVINQLSMSAISTDITGLSVVQSWEIDEKRVLEILISLLQGNALSIGDINDVQSIAQKCYVDFGISVYLAQAMSIIVSSEYYNQSTCGSGSGAKSLGKDSWKSEKGWSIVVQPNPADDLLSVSVLNHKDDLVPIISIIDLQGKLVYSQSATNESLTYSLSTADLIEGIYILKVQYGEEYNTSKISIVH